MRLKPWLISLLGLLLILASCQQTLAPAASPPAQEERLAVYFIDVGQGDAILLDHGEHEVLIDGGEKQTETKLVAFLKKHVDGPLEAMVATHPHADHIGGLSSVLKNFQVKDIWLNGDKATSKTYNDFMVAVNEEKAQVHQAQRGGTITVDALSFQILNPPSKLFNDTNNNSIVLRLAYGTTTILFTGDAEKEAEASMLGAGLDVRASILKVGHHGSRSSSSPAFLQAVQPSVAIYMAGVDNSYGHPHPETIAALQKVGAQIYGTDAKGTVTILADGQTYQISTEK
ncbi:MAG: MBL fold metallo-hydrolase [Chloroflexi bacterium]|nr:MBL fold metallo-hydrolase [Chloroflexota bacterium]